MKTHIRRCLRDVFSIANLLSDHNIYEQRRRHEQPVLVRIMMVPTAYLKTDMVAFSPLIDLISKIIMKSYEDNLEINETV